jgi:hypothetical protein
MKESKKKERRRDKPAATKGEKCRAGIQERKEKGQPLEAVLRQA